MRFVKLVPVILLLSAFQLTMAQSRPEEPGPVTPEFNLTKSVHLFPNPATEDVYVKTDQFPAEKVSLTLHSIIGNQLEIEETEIMDEQTIRVGVKELPPGYYFLAVKDEESKFRGTYKFLKR